MTHLLDTSAMAAYAFGEPGGGRVQELLHDSALRVELSSLSVFELWARLKRMGREEVFYQDWPAYRALLAGVASVDEVVAFKAVELRQAASSRVPALDLLIAATAVVHDAVLVHRDPHFAAIPGELLKQERLPDG